MLILAYAMHSFKERLNQSTNNGNVVKKSKRDIVSEGVTSI